MNKTKLLSISVPIFYVITLVFNGLASSGALNGIDTAAISAKYPVLFTPANYVFSIWGLIYLALGVFAVYQLLPKNFNEKSLDQVRLWFILTSILNSLWILFWQYEYILLSLPVMLLLLASLIKIYIGEGIGEKEVDNKRKWLIQAPFSLYLGWISVATIANVSVVLYDFGWNGFGISDEIWTIIMILVATLLGVLMIWKRKDYIFAAVLAWAFIGISIKNSELQSFTYAIVVAIGILFLSALLEKFMRSREAKS